MPAERVAGRNMADVGRFHGAPPTRVELTIQKEEEKKQQEGGCCHHFRRLFPLCFRRQNTSGSVVTDNVEMVKPLTPAPALPKPSLNGESSAVEDTMLSVRSVDLLSSQTGQNRKEHHTDLFHGEELIIRRGQTFQIELELNRPFSTSTDKLHLELKTGHLPVVSKGTHVIVPLVNELVDEGWEAKIIEKQGNKVKLSVHSCAKTVIGLYGLSVITGSLKGGSTSTHDSSKDIVMLFNPWCEEDTVFLDDEAERNEYVLNNLGRIYYGTDKQIGARTWIFGQFDEGILQACLFVLEKSRMPPSGCWDPVNVVRVISAMINAQDDFGVLEGNWSGNYVGGVSPTAWSSSVEILRKYHASEGTPVKYGQCWVFSGITTTVLRCLGIPARSVTNFQSAHDTDVSLTTDVYFNEALEPIEALNRDSVWNFHVWNDCWMARPDLPPGNGGWQAVDATPQETSHGTFRCGPASVNAIRSGQVYLQFDSPFVFAEVNSDKIYWKKNPDGTFTQFHCEKKAVGHNISTKAVGSDERHDITHLYKYTEGSEEERIAVETASRYGSKPNMYASPMAEDVHVLVNMNSEGLKIGTDAQLTIEVKNLSSQPRQTTLHSQVAVMYYTGVLKGTFKKEKIPVELKPNEVKIINWVLPYQNYQDQLVDQAALMLTLSGKVSETNQVLANQTTFRLHTPDLSIQPLGEAIVGKEMAAKIIFTNPLPKTLRDVIFRVEGLGLQKGHEVIVGDVSGHATVTLTEHFVPVQPGHRKLVATLDCKQLTQVHGVADIIVKEQ